MPGEAMPDVTVRALDDADELRASEAVFRIAMVGLPGAAPLWNPDSAEPDPILSQREPGRTFGAFCSAADGGGESLVGATDSTSGMLTVPGGERVPHAAVTHVGVLPTHTRRGVLTALMRRQLRDCRERGESVATLRASEAPIYGRFGYGMASTAHTVELDLRKAKLTGAAAAMAEAGPPVRLVDPDSSWQLLQTIEERHPARRAGAISRGEQWWNGRKARAGRGSAGPRYVAVCGAPGRESGFAVYRPLDTSTWFTSGNRTVFVEDFHAPDAAAHRALMAFLLRLDLVHTVRFPWLPADDPLPLMLTDYRAARVTGVSDETWLRLVDVPRTLAARTYGRAGPVVMEVRDALLPENSGVYRIAPGGAERLDSAEAAEDAGAAEADRGGVLPDASTAVGDLASAYLGGVSWSSLHAAGRLQVPAGENPLGATGAAGAADAAVKGAAPAAPGDVVRRLDALFATVETPFAGVMF